MSSIANGTDDERISLNWCVPLLNDAISFEYLQLLGAKTQQHAYLTTLHVRFHTKLLEHDNAAALSSRRQLVDAAQREKLTVENLEKIDKAFLHHLTTIILRRDKIRNHKHEKQVHILLDVAVRLGELKDMAEKPKVDTKNIQQMLSKL
jgi:hypothetical protein